MKLIFDQHRLAGLLIIASTLMGLGIAFACMFPWYSTYDIDGGLQGIKDGTVPAILVFLMVVGLVFYFPTLLTGTDRGEDGHQVSLMRLAVLMVVCVFCVINVKTGWENGLTKEQLDGWWLILAVTLGSKAAQYFGEVQSKKLPTTSTETSHPTQKT